MVTFRGVANVEVDEGVTYLARATAIRQRFEAIGATLCAWGAQTFSLELAARDFEAAVALVVDVANEDAPAPYRFRIGIAQGPMTTVEGSGATLGALVDDIDSQHPGIKNRLVTEEGKLHRFVNVYVNDEDVRFLGALDAKLSEGDVVAILPAVAGGSGGLRPSPPVNGVG